MVVLGAAGASDEVFSWVVLVASLLFGAVFLVALLRSLRPPKRRPK